MQQYDSEFRVGVDFDNTIVCYDELFHRIALERNLISPDLPKSKNTVRDFLRRCGNEDAWTEMQGYVYGERMAEAVMFPDALDFFIASHQNGISAFIISHKTRHPYAGPEYDLHNAARQWLDSQGFFNTERTGLTQDRIFFELTKEEKLQRIGSCRCSCFIDDLPELLAEPDFPKGVKKILFDPHQAYCSCEQFTRVESWRDLFSIVEEMRR